MSLTSCDCLAFNNVTGAFLCTLARKILKIPMARYVDDFFSGERSESVVQAMECFARQLNFHIIRIRCMH